VKPSALWLLVLSQFLVCNELRAQTLTAVDDFVSTLPNTPILIAVLTNDLVVATNQTAILRVTQPLHGTVIINPGSISNPVLSSLFQFAAIQLSNTVVQIANTNLYPWTTQSNGTWTTQSVADTSWVPGFFPGAMWLIYQYGGDANYRTWAEKWMGAIAPEQYSTNTDDVGFMINTSYGNAYRLTGNPAYKAVVLQAAQSFSNRFNPAVGCLADDTFLSPPQFQVVIDTMMNTELLYNAYDLGGSSNLYNYALSHAGRTITNQIRPDGSTYQEVIYNVYSGAVLSVGNRVSIPSLDTWARGHSWGIHAFPMVFQQTGDTRFLGAAEQTANFYINQVPSDYVPYWYFQTNGSPPNPPLKDSSAASSTLSGLVQLSQLETN
jgi:unsaturated chondroitin disaccharide hydrolase